MQLRQFICLCALGVMLSHKAAALPIVTPFINELHYDNLGTDTHEFIEIAGSAQSLLGFSLALYNGGNGTRYRSIPLDDAIPDERDGFGAVSVFVNGLQNGPADGVALVDAFDRVLDWLTYEGQLLAQDGPAAGLLSNALNVFESPTTTAGLSLQRTGAGLLGADFDWAGPLPNSPGSLNAGQQFVGATASVAEPAPVLLLGLGLLLIALSAPGQPHRAGAAVRNGR